LFFFIWSSSSIYPHHNFLHSLVPTTSTPPHCAYFIVLSLVDMFKLMVKGVFNVFPCGCAYYELISYFHYSPLHFYFPLSIFSTAFSQYTSSFSALIFWIYLPNVRILSLLTIGSFKKHRGSWLLFCLVVAFFCECSRFLRRVTCTAMFTATKFTIAKLWKKTKVPYDWWMDQENFVCIHNRFLISHKEWVHVVWR
jgi:hypothetical protein